METDSGADDEGPFFPWLPPEDRLWRHPSEVPAAGQPGAAGGSDRYPTEPIAPLVGGSGRHSMRSRSAQSRSGVAGSYTPGRLWSVAIVAGLIGALAASGLGLATGIWTRSTTVIRASIPSSPTVSLADAGSSTVNWTAVDDSVAPIVVSVSTDTPSGPQSGSGLVLVSDSNGNGKAYVATDRSLLSAAQSVAYVGAIRVTFLSGNSVNGHLVGQDPLSGIAVVEVPDVVKASPNIGTVAGLRDADQILAVGARDLPGSSVFTGSVSGQDREVSLTDGSDIDGLIALTLPSMTHTATGGPVLDQFGRVVGITVDPDASDTADQGFTFAVPIDEVTRVATQIINRDQITHPWLGLSNAEDVPSMMAHQLGLAGGVQAESVDQGSPAARAGLQAHDIITSFNGKPVDSTGALTSMIAVCRPGDLVSVTYIHNGHSLHAVIRLGSEAGS